MNHRRAPIRLHASTKMNNCKSVKLAPAIVYCAGLKISGSEMYCLDHTSAAVYCSSIETPIAVIRGARRGARRSGR